MTAASHGRPRRPIPSSAAQAVAVPAAGEACRNGRKAKSERQTNV
jgi:hypothetical protein